MRNIEDYPDCPKCGYEGALYEYDPETKETWLLCERCGYEVRDSIDWEKSSPPDILIWKHEEEGGNGYLRYAEKGKSSSMVSVDEARICAMKEHLDKLAVAKYSFQENGKWFVRDLLSNKTIPFSYVEMRE